MNIISLFNKKGDFSPFSRKLFKQNKIILFVLLLTFNHLAASVVDLFDLEKYFSAPGDETDLKNKFLLFLIITGFVAPIIEEFLFRFWILEKRIKFIIILMLLILCLLLIDYHWVFNVSFLLIFIVQAILIFKNPKKILIIAILNGFTFSLFHITNYPVYELYSNIIYLPILFFPQFILGLITSGMKINYGFKFAVLYHILYNSSIIVFVYLRMMVS